MPKRDSIPVTIYQLEEKLNSDNEFSDITHRLIRFVNEKRTNKFVPETVLIDNPEFQINLFHTHKISPPTWKDFLDPILSRQSPLLNSLNTTYSFICIIAHTENIYAITGGAGSYAIDNFISPTFGLDILVRIIDEDEKVIKEIKERDVTGTVLGLTKFYRGDQSISNDGGFGKIFKLIKAELNKRNLVESLGFSADEIKRKSLGCYAKESFKISKAIKFPTLLRLIEKFTKLQLQETKFELNKVVLISKRRRQNHQLLRKLRLELIQRIYFDVRNNTPIDYDFCHTKYEEYHTADRFSVFFEEERYFTSYDPPSFEELISNLITLGKFFAEDLEWFQMSVLNLDIESYDANGETLTTGKVLEHLHGEIKYNGETYFFVDKEWYYIQPDFIEDLNNACREVIKQCWDEELFDVSFDTTKEEKDFNLKFLKKHKSWVLDTITPQNIEACDILVEKGESLNLIHVKKGFNNNMRDLAAQVIIAAKRILHSIKTDYKYIELLEQKLRNGLLSESAFSRNLASQDLPEDGLQSLFNRKDHQIVFCLAFVDTAKDVRSLKTDVESFDSNIAKYALVNLKKEIQSLGFKFKIIQIKREG